MRKRIITYDLSFADNQDYSEFYKVIDELNGSMLTESTYIIKTSLTQEEIINKIRKTISKNDIVYFISVNEYNELFYKKINK